MKVIDFVVKNYINENNSLIDTLKDLHKEYINTKDTSGAIMRVISNLDRFELVLSQIPNLILRIKSLHEGYVARFPDMSPIFQNILAQADKCKARYDSDVKPILEVTPELKNDILFSNL
ncbi:MAG: hypothetical protein HYZ54_05585 [Ignavibacteriae bacterium]|nr:hypothetical protein [Ignavibacteriota bacterium]